MGFSMEDRVKAGPLGPKWQKLKGRHKALSGKLFKPDLGPTLDKYDKSLVDYANERKEEENLKSELTEVLRSAGESATEIADLSKELEQVTAKWKQEQTKHIAVVMKFGQSGAGELSEVEGHFDNLISAAETYVNERKKLYDSIDGTAVNNLNVFKKAQKSLGEKAKAVYDARLKLADVAIGATVEAQGILRDYIDVADDADHPEITKDLQAFKGTLD